MKELLHELAAELGFFCHPTTGRTRDNEEIFFLAPLPIEKVKSTSWLKIGTKDTIIWLSNPKCSFDLNDPQSLPKLKATIACLSVELSGL